MRDSQIQQSLFQRLLGHVICLVALWVYTISLIFLERSRPRKARRRRRQCQSLRLLITGRFDSLNWCRAHLLPIAEAECVHSMLLAVDGPVVNHEKIRITHTPRWLRRCLGRSISRSIWAVWLARVTRPDVVIGYHFFPAALTALLSARLSGARSVYQMTAGPVELDGAGLATESRWLLYPMAFVRRLQPIVLRLCQHFDSIVVRGHRARDYINRRAAPKRVDIIPGSIDVSRFAGGNDHRPYDIALVGRLVPVKQPEHFLLAAKATLRRTGKLRAVVVGSGPLRAKVEELAKSLELTEHVELLGHREDVSTILKNTRVFTLTSRSEGLSIALVEAMSAGAVPVVADVGDLRELVQDEVTGWLIAPGNFEGYAEKISQLLTDRGLWRRLSVAAQHRAAENNSLDVVKQQWERCLSAISFATTSATIADHAARLSVPGRAAGLWSARSYRRWRHGIPPYAKRAVSPVLRVAGPKRLLGRRFGANLRYLRRVDRADRSSTETLRLSGIRQICTLAFERSVFYRRLFDEAGVHPASIKNVDDLQRLPVIDRKTVRNHTQEMLVTGPGYSSAKRCSTGGTSGKPLFFYLNSNRSESEYAYLLLSWRRVGYELGMPMAVLRGQIVGADRRGTYHEYDPLLRHHYYSSFHMGEEEMEKYVNHMTTIGPCFLHVYPSTVLALARFLKRKGRPAPPNVLGIIAESEIVYPEQRRLAEEVFGCRMFSCYGQSEKVVLASGCEYSDDYHVWPTYGYFELLDEDGNPATAPGQRGEIVGTSFINTVMPFIRYRTGDYATYVGDHCERCGRNHPIIRDIRGHRTQEYLLAANGSRIPWAALNMHDDTFLNVRQFQFFQDTPGEAELRVVPAGEFVEADRERLLEGLAPKLDGQLSLKVRAVASIKLSPRGKAIYVDQRVSSDRL